MSLKVNLLLTGDEIMAGDIVDSNSSYIAKQFKAMGLSIHQKITVGDDMDLLVSSLQQLSESGDILIVNGGLGPTVDDLTAQALAKCCEEPLAEHPAARQHLDTLAETRNLKLNAANLKQAMLPASAEVIANRIGTAVGFSVIHNGCYIACTPGVPRELFPMLEEEILLKIAERFTIDNRTHIRRLCSFGLGESSLQELIDSNITIPSNVELGFRAGPENVEIKLTSRGADALASNNALADELYQLMPDHIFGENDESLANCLVKLLTEKQLTATTAESCTGGQISSAITGIAGSSSVFEAGFVTYSNRIKQQLLGVSEQTLASQGAVSEETVREMCAGALEVSGADIGVAVSGVAGPGGGSDEKPVGTVWIAWGFKGQIKAQKYFWPRQRNSFQAMVTRFALDLLRREILGLDTQNCHFQAFMKNT